MHRKRQITTMDRDRPTELETNMGETQYVETQLQTVLKDTHDCVTTTYEL